MIRSIIILLIGLWQFSVQSAEMDKLPNDNGRLEVVECLAQSLAWEKTNIIETDDHYARICEATTKNKLAIENEIKAANQDPKNILEQVLKCLINLSEVSIKTWWQKRGDNKLKDKELIENTPNGKPKDKILDICNTTIKEMMNIKIEIQAGNEPAQVIGHVRKCWADGIDASIEKLLEQRDLGKIEEYITKTANNILNTRIKLQEGEVSDSTEVINEIRPCFSNRATSFINRYKSYAPLNLDNISVIGEVAVGLCEQKEMVSFQNLDESEQQKAARCLQGCASKLFQKFESKFLLFEKDYETRRQNGELRKYLESTENPKLRNAKLELPEKFTLEKTVDDYNKECNGKRLLDVDTLNIIGNDYTISYIKAIDELYEYGPAISEKDEFYAIINSYFACIIFSCSMQNQEDFPIRDILGQIITFRSPESYDLVINFWESDI